MIPAPPLFHLQSHTLRNCYCTCLHMPCFVSWLTYVNMMMWELTMYIPPQLRSSQVCGLSTSFRESAEQNCPIVLAIQGGFHSHGGVTPKTLDGSGKSQSEMDDENRATHMTQRKPPKVPVVSSHPAISPPGLRAPTHPPESPTLPGAWPVLHREETGATASAVSEAKYGAQGTTMDGML